ncbi:MAG: response regulator [Opitutaceae bacterium]|nr:response regulator [Opitutaceae bacterium]
MKRILHIDDELEIRNILSACLQSHGYEVFSAANATEALQTLRQAQPDLVICDLQLDEGDGLQTIDQLRNALPNLPIILLTGVLLDPHVAQETMQTKRIVYLDKTNTLQRIVDEIRRLIH